MVVSNVHVLARVHRASDAAIPAARALAGAVLWGGRRRGQSVPQIPSHIFSPSVEHGATRSNTEQPGEGERHARCTNACDCDRWETGPVVCIPEQAACAKHILPHNVEHRAAKALAQGMMQENLARAESDSSIPNQAPRLKADQAEHTCSPRGNLRKARAQTSSHHAEWLEKFDFAFDHRLFILERLWHNLFLLLEIILEWRLVMARLCRQNSRRAQLRYDRLEVGFGECVSCFTWLQSSCAVIGGQQWQWPGGCPQAVISLDRSGRVPLRTTCRRPLVQERFV